MVAASTNLELSIVVGGRKDSVLTLPLDQLID
jgi:hypothetical protein